MRRLAVLAVLATTPAWAEDDVQPDRPTSVGVAMVGTTARMTARFAIEVDGPGLGMNLHAITIPREAVVTSGSLVVAGKRHRMQLQLADAADRSFDAMTLKPGRDGDRAWVALISGTSDVVSVDILAPRAADVVVELTLESPTCFFADARFVELPATWWERIPATQRNAIRVDDDTITAACPGSVDGASRWLGIASRQLANQPAGPRRIGVIAGRLALAAKDLARVEIDLAARLGDTPRDLHTAIVIDHSRSMTTDELEAQRAIVAAYVRAAPTSRVQVIGYARRAKALLPSWTMAMHAAPRIDREIRGLSQRNGSNLDEALREAAAWLARVQGTRRIVLFSDERLARRFGTEPLDVLRPLLAQGVLVHVVVPSPGAALERHDDGALAAIAHATQGIEVTGGADERGVVDATMLVRPVSLDSVTIGGRGWHPFDELFDERACTDSLREGHACTGWVTGGGVSGPLTITGKIWNTPFSRVLRPDPAQALALARMLSVTRAFDEELQAEIDRLALAVNSVWSLFALWGGSGGYEDVAGFGTSGGGRFSTSSHDHGIGTIGRGRAWSGLELRGQLQPALAACDAGDAPITVTVETTREEIVEVTVDTPDPALRDCIVEAVWELTLRIADPPAHATTRVAFGNKT